MIFNEIGFFRGYDDSFQCLNTCFSSRVATAGAKLQTACNVVTDTP